MNIAWIYQRIWLLIRLPIAIAAIAVTTWLWLFVHPMPPNRLSISTAGDKGSYHRMAIRYAEAFSSRGVQLDIQTSEGTQQNLDRLVSSPPQADLALVQGGFGILGAATSNRERSRIETLANVNTEAVWIFSLNRNITSLNQLTGLRVAVGPERSGSRKVALKLFEQARIDPKTLTLLPQFGLASVGALQQGLVDVLFTVSPRDSATIQNLISLPGIQIASLNRLAAIVERNTYLETSLLAQGALASNLPARDTGMLTMSTSLVAREGLHPALKRLAIATAMELNTTAGLFHRAGEFPSLRRIDFPTAPMARSVLSGGLRLHEKLLPFWWAQFLERFALLVLPVGLIALWLMQQIPQYLRWALQSRVNRWYGELKFIENDLSHETVSGLDLTRFLSRLNGIDRAVLAFECPKDLTARCYTLHQHIEFVRQRLYRMRGR